MTSTGASEAKDWARETVRGFWASPMVSFDEQLQLYEDGIRQNVDTLINLDVNGMGFGFSEPWHLSLHERKQAMEMFIGAVSGRVPCYIHATSHSVGDTVEIMNTAKSLGADAVMLWVPFEFAKSQSMAIDWFEYVGSLTDLPVILYNTFHSGLKLSLETLERLARIPAVGAIKNGVNDFAQTAALVDRIGHEVVVSEPLEEHLPVAIRYLDQQVMLGTTSIYLMQTPACQPIRDYAELMWGGKFSEGWSKYHALQPLRDVWANMYRVLWKEDNATHPIGLIKVWMDAVGMYGGPARPPGTDVRPADKEWLLHELEASGWLEKLLHSD